MFTNRWYASREPAGIASKAHGRTTPDREEAAQQGLIDNQPSDFYWTWGSGIGTAKGGAKGGGV